MHRSLRGAYLSGLVYPGAGQIVQKHYFRGLALIGVVTASLIAIASSALTRIEAVLGNIESSGGAPEVRTIVREAVELTTSLDDPTVKIASVLILCCWVIAIVDAYLSGKRTDLDHGARSKASKAG